jgi:GTPase SAR1 family protein
VRVHLWDLSGAPDYVDVRSELYFGSDAVLLVYDVANSSSFIKLDGWLQELNSFGLKNFVVCLVGNKVRN